MPFSINGEQLTIVDATARNLGRRSYRQEFRSSQGVEAAPVTAQWVLSGPMGNSRGYFGQTLALDYTENLDHQYPFLLTSPAKRNATTLSAISSTQELVPSADVSVHASWNFIAGSNDATAWNDLDEGSAAADDAVSYYRHNESVSVAMELQMGTPSPAITAGVILNGESDFSVSWRGWMSENSGTSPTIKVEVIQGAATVIWTNTEIRNSDTAWLTRTHTLGQAVADLVTDWTDIHVKLTGSTGNNDVFYLSTVWMSVPDSSGGNIITIDEDRSGIFVQRGSDSTQLNSSDMTEVESVSHDGGVTDSVATFQGAGFVAIGAEDVVQKRTAVTASGSTYADVTGCEAFKMGTSDDRLWYVDAITTPGKVRFVVDDWADTTDISNPLQVMDPQATATGIYSDGDHLIAGFDRGANSFTNTGASESLMESVKDFPSTRNGASGDRLWGWFYIATSLGLMALHVERGIENPVGPGEGQDGLGFEGPIDGYPTAVKAFKDTLWVAYLNPDGTTYVFRGVFGPQTAASGRPDWYAFRKYEDTVINAFGGTSGRDNPTLLIGEDLSTDADVISYYTLSTRGREIADSNYEFGTDGGTAYGTTMMLPSGARANLRWAKFVTENCVASTDTWQLAVDVDDAASYVDIGSAVTSNGMQTVRPVSSGSPLATTTFNRIKPRLTQVASSETSPPQIRGDLTMGFDLRPDVVREINVVIELDNIQILRDLETLVSDDTLIPVSLRLPTDDDVNTNRFAYISELEVYDRTSLEDMVVELTLIEWSLS